MHDRSSARRRAALATVALLVASLVPSPLARHPEWERVGPDKALHLLGHAGYAVALADALAGERRTRLGTVLLAVALSTLHSLVTGRLQERVPGRAFERADVAAGLLGSALGAVGWWIKNEDGDTS